ncbi:hypothetical protein [Streptomyces sp. NPDC059489]|uniref:hypothetical protein n=1 Tax=Streptomyces sp. NPDC059489 TaxID=3346849 RepID=UPI003679C766
MSDGHELDRIAELAVPAPDKRCRGLLPNDTSLWCGIAIGSERGRGDTSAYTDDPDQNLGRDQMEDPDQLEKDSPEHSNLLGDVPIRNRDPLGQRGISPTRS